MKILLDGLWEEVPAGTTAARLIELSEVRDSTLVVEVNGRFVPPREYDGLELKDGDRVELILPAFGG
ncbi:MAG: sulfur carrier protein ThiS [Pseudomonadota bacterium]